jgi:hypothetical protein
MSEVALSWIESERLRIRRFQDSALTLFIAYRNDPEVACYQAQDFVGENPDDRRSDGRDAQVPARASGPCGQSPYADRGGNDGPT